MESPKSTDTMITGRKGSIGPALPRPSSSLPHPCWKMATTTPKDDATAATFMAAALTGMPMERNASSSRTQPRATTTPTNSGSLPTITAAKSSYPAVSPPTYTRSELPSSAPGRTSARSRPTSSEVARDCGAGPTGSADACIAEAVASPARPFLISDSGDNPTAGGAGDLAHMLGRLLANDDLAAGRATALHPGLTDPAAVAECFAAGLGACVDLRVGGRVSGPDHGGPYDLTGEVVALRRDDPVGGDLAAVRRGGVTVVLVSRRKPFQARADFGELDPRGYDLIVVKSGHPEPELCEMAADWRLALTPGGVDQDLPRLGHRRVQRPLYPFDDEGFEVPRLDPLLL
jgi:hypothetical protein